MRLAVVESAAVVHFVVYTPIKLRVMVNDVSPNQRRCERRFRCRYTRDGHTKVQDDLFSNS